MVLVYPFPIGKRRLGLSKCPLQHQTRMFAPLGSPGTPQYMPLPVIKNKKLLWNSTREHTGELAVGSNSRHKQNQLREELREKFFWASHSCIGEWRQARPEFLPPQPWLGCGLFSLFCRMFQLSEQWRIVGPDEVNVGRSRSFPLYGS